MPVTDAITYLHGSGTSVYGPVTTTPNIIATGSQSGTVVTISTVTSGYFYPGQVITGTGVLPNTLITSFGTGTGLAGTYNVSQSATVASLAGANAGITYGDPITAAGYSNLELDFGAPNTGGNYPYLTEFPSYNEKQATNPAENVGSGSTQLGVHVIVNAPFNLLTNINFQVCTSMTTQATFNSTGNPIAARTLSLAQLQNSGTNYFIPVSGNAVLEFLRVYFGVGGTSATAGTITCYWGPANGGDR